MVFATTGTIHLGRVTTIPRPAFIAAWLLVAAEAVTLAGLGDSLQLGVVAVSPMALACPLALAVACIALRGEEPPLRREVLASRWLWATLAAGLAGPLAAWYLASPRFSGVDALGLATGAALEETVFRIALPVCIWQLLRMLGWRRAAVVVAAVAAVATFALMPGHVAQMTSLAGVVPFACLALLLLGVVWIGRDPLLAVATHFGVNAWMLAATFGAVPPVVGRLGTAAVVIPVGVALARRTRVDARRPTASRPASGLRRPRPLQPA